MNQHNTTGALHHFTRAQSIDPDFCDVHSGLGQYYIAVNDVELGRKHLLTAAHCPYVANTALKHLNVVWASMLSEDTSHIESVREEMAEVRPSIPPPHLPPPLPYTPTCTPLFPSVGIVLQRRGS